IDLGRIGRRDNFSDSDFDRYDRRQAMAGYEFNHDITPAAPPAALPSPAALIADTQGLAGRCARLTPILQKVAQSRDGRHPRGTRALNDDFCAEHVRLLKRSG
ncbi:hypothetical protein ACIKTA_12625, partial [Hansschlegelia beijingensis]